MNIGIGIQSVRKQLHLAQYELAEKSGISATSLSQIENGVKRPNPKTLKSICAVLDVPEMVIYLASMKESDVPDSKRNIYNLVYPSLMNLTMQMVSTEHLPLLEKGQS